MAWLIVCAGCGGAPFTVDEAVSSSSPEAGASEVGLGGELHDASRSVDSSESTDAGGPADDASPTDTGSPSSVVDSGVACYCESQSWTDTDSALQMLCTQYRSSTTIITCQQETGCRIPSGLPTTSCATAVLPTNCFAGTFLFPVGYQSVYCFPLGYDGGI